MDSLKPSHGTLITEHPFLMRKLCHHVQSTAYPAGIKPVAAQRSAVTLEPLLLDPCGFWQWPQAWGTSQAHFPLLQGDLASSPSTQARRTHIDGSTYSGLLQVSFSLPICPANPVTPDTTIAWPSHRCFVLGHARLVGTPWGRHLHPDLALRHQQCKGTSQMPSTWEFACSSSEDCFS